MSFYKDIWFLFDCIDVSDVTNNNTNVGHIHWHHYTGDTLCSVLKMLQVQLQNLSGGEKYHLHLLTSCWTDWNDLLARAILWISLVWRLLETFVMM